jgi:hypothetical protein
MYAQKLPRHCLPYHFTMVEVVVVVVVDVELVMFHPQ